MIVCCLHADIIMRVTVLIVLLCFTSAVVDVCFQTVSYISFNGMNLPNHSYINFTQVMKGVQCHTDLTTCCTAAQGDDRGDWYFPDGERLTFSTLASNIVYEMREAQRVDLNVRGSPTLPEGIYRCGIETSATSNDNRETVYVGLYKHNNRGQYTFTLHVV